MTRYPKEVQMKVSREQLEEAINNLKEDLDVSEKFRESDRTKINRLESENKVYKKQVGFYERIIEGLLGVIDD